MSRKKLLIIDKQICYMAELQGAGYRILQAGDGLDAINLISTARQTGKDFDLIIADMMLLDLATVPDLIKNMKARDISIPVCAVSAYRSNETNMELLYAGCSAFISDPFEPGRLLEFVDEILNAPS